MIFYVFNGLNELIKTCVKFVFINFRLVDYECN